MNKPTFTFSASADNVGRISIEGTIGESWYNEDGNTSSKIADLIAEAKNAGCCSYHVRIHSLGGDVDHALAIYSLLKSLPNLTTEVIGMCASAATVIFMAGTTRIMDSSALFLIHHAWTAAMGNAQQIERTVETLKTIDDTMVSIYSQATGLSADEVCELMNANDGDGKWISAAECKKKNFCTEVSSSANAAAKQHYFAMADLKSANLPIPEQLEELSPSTWAKIKNLIQSLTKTPQNMKKNIVAAYACLASIFSEIMADENDNVNLKAEDLQKIEDKLSADAAAIANLESQVNDLNNKLASASSDKEAADKNLAEANDKIASLQAIVDKHAENKVPVNGSDTAPSEFETYQQNSPAYIQAQKDLANF